MKLFYLDEYLENIIVKRPDSKSIVTTLSAKEKFQALCNEIEKKFQEDWQGENGKNSEASDVLLERQKNAIIGHEKEVNFFKDKIKEYLRNNSLMNEYFPEIYPDLVTALFQEIWGFSVISEWKTDKYKESTSAKIIGNRIYFMINGKQVLQEHSISNERLNQLKKALLLRNPDIRLGSKNYAEVYMLDGTRITIFDNPLAKEPGVVFRKYIVKYFTFEEQVRRKTIPKEIVPMCKSMIDLGYNIAFLGPVRSAKTTFLETWQSYEDPTLEGIMVETDPEIPLHVIMPSAPIMQIVADGDRLKHITKHLMRGDGDYLIMAEARDPVALKVSVELTSKGTRRTKITYHCSDPVDFPYDAASNIISEFGGDLNTTIAKVAKSFHYYFEFCQLKDKSKKRLKSIHEVRLNSNTGEITMHQICKYHPKTDSWTFKYDIGQDKEEYAYYESEEALESFKAHLKSLEATFPMSGEHIKRPIYGRLMK